MIYTALTAMNAAMDRQRAIASNLSNAHTTGFRSETFSVNTLTLRGPSLETRAMAQGSVRGANLAAGRAVPTGRDLDLALRGDALIALQAADGSEVYSRRGDLAIGAAGVLENGDGRPVMGAAGPITVPLGAQVTVAEDGRVMAADPATPDQPAEEIARIRLVSPAGSRIVKNLDGFFEVVGGGVLPVDETARADIGSLEESNVDTAQTLVEMIEAQRSFEQRSKLFSTVSELDQAGSRLMSLRG
ncbi:flagellar basal body rod protein FlgF [Aurantiacibacter luteus]